MTAPTLDQASAITTSVRQKVTIASVDDFPLGTRREVKVGRATIAVFNIGGAYYAIYGRCPHQSAPLSRGRLQGTVICSEETCWETEWAYEGEVVVCPGHAMEFHVKTGKAIGYNLNLRTYDVLVEDGQVKLII